MPTDTPNRKPKTEDLSGFLDARAIKKAKHMHCVWPMHYLTGFSKVLNSIPSLFPKHDIEMVQGEIYELIDGEVVADIAKVNGNGVAE